jgi:hypothetical protein
MSIKDPQPTKLGSMPTPPASAAPNLPGGQGLIGTQKTPAAGDQTTEGHISGDTHIPRALGSNHPPTIVVVSTPTVAASAGSNSTDGHIGNGAHATLAVRGPLLADPILGIAADVVDDLERVRIANENRYRTLTATDEFGHGLSPEHPDVARLSAIIDALGKAEHQAILNLQRVMRAHPLGAWVKEQPGVGEKQAARLLATIRDPYWNDLHDRPRTVSELWAYSGLHVLPGGQLRFEAHSASAAGSNVHTSGHASGEPHGMSAAGVAPKRQRGQKANWNEDARKRAWLIAASCVKQPTDTRWRKVYDETRTKYAEAVHNDVCVRCGPKGKPAQPDSPLSLGHQHARALRAVAKAILKDLWLESKRLHQEQADGIAA